MAADARGGGVDADRGRDRLRKSQGARVKKQRKQEERTVRGADVGRWSWEGDWKATAAAAQAVSPFVVAGIDIISYRMGGIEIAIRKKGDGGAVEVYTYPGLPWLPAELAAYLQVMRLHGLVWSGTSFLLNDGGKCWLAASHMGVHLADAL